MVKEPRLDGEMLREGIEQIAEQAERAGDIVHRLRELMRGGIPQRSATDLSIMLDAAAALVETEASRNKVDISFHLSPDPPPVLADRIEIEQVLVNLLRNAIEAASQSRTPERTVRVTVEPKGLSELEVAVADSGPGVSDEVTPQLFDPFVTTKPEGMGLGLAISQSIIEVHGGRLKLVHSSGRGAVFAFTLPIANGERAYSGR